MKIQRKNSFSGSKPGPGAPKRSEDGSVTLVFFALLAIMMILLTADSRALLHLRREVKFLEQQQIKRLNYSPTNSVAIAPPESK